MAGVWLMYHEVYAREPPSGVAAGAALYHVPRATFRAHLGALTGTGVAVCTVGDWVAGRSRGVDHVALTFDDGWEGSLRTGVELLSEAGLTATFFLTRDFVGTNHHAGPGLIREARAAGMELGTHGTTHRLLADCTEDEIRSELAGSKAFLEDLLGEPVEVGSVPGGAWSPLVARVARECGYRALCTSRPGANEPHTDPMRLRRVAVRSGTDTAAVRRYARGAGTREVARAAALDLPRRVLGRHRYARLRARLLGDSSDGSVR